MTLDRAYFSLRQSAGMACSVDNPAVVLLHSQVAACGASFDAIVNSVPETVSDNDWHGTSRHVWDEERTRFMVWAQDLSGVIREIYEMNPDQTIKIASSNILANVRDLAEDLMEGKQHVIVSWQQRLTNLVLAVVDGSRLPLERQEDACEQVAAEEEDDELNPREMVGRLEAVSSTINGLTRMLKLQYSYALESTPETKHDSSDMLQTESVTFSRRYGVTASGHGWSGQLDPSFSGSAPTVATDGTKWALPRLDISDLAPAMLQQQSFALPSVFTKGAHGQARRDLMLKRSAPSEQNPRNHADRQPSSAMQMVRHTGIFKLMPRRFFRVGRVLMVLWTEPAGESGLSPATSLLPSASNEKVYAKIRRFIVVQQKELHALAVPVLSDKGIGSSALKMRGEDHAIAYMGPEIPQPAENEGAMLRPSIRINPDNLTERLSSSWRIDYGKIYTIETNIKCRSVGMVHETSIASLLIHHFNVQWRRNSSKDLQRILLKKEGSVDRVGHTESGSNFDVVDPGTQASFESRSRQPNTPAPALLPVNLGKRIDRGSDSGYGNSEAATEARSVALSTSDGRPSKRIIEDDDLGPGRIFTIADDPKPEVPVIDPDNPNPEQFQALSDSSFQLLLESVLGEQKRRLRPHTVVDDQSTTRDPERCVEKLARPILPFGRPSRSKSI